MNEKDPERLLWGELGIALEKTAEGWTITGSHLEATAQVPGVTSEAFATAAQNAKAGCPISKLLNTNITMDSKLEQA